MKNQIYTFIILLIYLQLCSGIFYRYIDRPRISTSDSTYDFIIVGAGSAGTVLARRLSENPNWRILLLEVGKMPSIISDIPYLCPALQFTDYVWNYKMERTPGACLGMENQQCHWPRGRGVGGTSLINYMIYTRGHRNDYERWKNDGNPGWGYEDVLKYYKKSEDVNLVKYDEGYHHKGGPLSVEDVRWRSNLAGAFVQAGVEMGYKYIDYNGEDQTGFSFVQANTRRGIRDSGYRAFIKPVEQRSNLHILTEARATKLLINPDTKQVFGVEYIKDKKYQYVNVSKEVILSAGPLTSPQLLMLSGIGPRSHLESLGIPVHQDLPVGQNLHDHITFPGLIFHHEGGGTGIPHPKELLTFGPMLEWIKSGRGLLSSIGGVEVLGYFNTNTSKVNIERNMPDMELIILNGRFDTASLDILRQSLNIRKEIFYPIFNPLVEEHITVVLPMHLKPHSIGYMELKSQNPYHWPKFYSNQLSDPENLDVKAFIAAIRFVQKLLTQNPFEQFKTKQVPAVSKDCEMHTYDSDQHWECAIRLLCTTLHHQVGTCKMGPKDDSTAVVDNRLKVHGLKSLRVSDSSIIPFALNAHTNAPAFMIGEKTADIIKEDYSYYSSYFY